MSIDSLIRKLEKAIEYLTKAERTQIEKAIERATAAHEGKTRQDGSPYVIHLLEVALILADWGADAETLIAGILHDALEDTPMTEADIRHEFGDEVADLVQGVTKFTQVDFIGEESLDRKIETLRKLFEVMRSDIRVIVVKLADRLHNVRTMDALPQERLKRFAQETLDVYVKIANRLGLTELRKELGDRCTPIVHPEKAKELLELREHMLKIAEKIGGEIRSEIEDRGAKKLLLNFFVRHRSLSSMYEKDVNLELSERHAYFLAIITRDIDSCYALLKLVHELYRPVSGKFRDFIAAPTDNGYQSLHTTVVGPRNHIVQIRIRTPEMDQRARRGILLSCFEEGAQESFAWLKRAESLDQSTRESSDAFWHALQSDIFPENVQVTVGGQVVSLAQGSTALDAIYAAYGSDAHRLQSCQVNSMRKRFSHEIQEEDVITVHLSRSENIKFEWLQDIKTSYARSLITEALKEKSREEKMQMGKKLLQKELDYFKRGLLEEVPHALRKKVSTHFQRESFDNIVIMVGEGVLAPEDIVFRLFPEHKRRRLFPGQRADREYPFRLYITGTQGLEQQALPKVTALAGMHGITIQKTTTAFDPGKQTFNLTMTGRATGRQEFADFLYDLEKQDWVSTVQTLISPWQQLTAIALFAIAFCALLGSLIFIPAYQQFLIHPRLPLFFVYPIPFIPVFIANVLLLRYMRQYSLRMRSEKWILGVGFALNIIAITLVSWQISSVFGQINILSMFLVLIVSLIFLVYILFFSEALIGSTEISRKLTPGGWEKKKRDKIIGYSMRLIAIAIWGVGPIIVRYAFREIPPTFAVSFSFLISALFLIPLIVLYRIFKKGKKITKESYHPLFWIAVVFDGLMWVLIFLGLNHTTASNNQLFMNFAPVMALLFSMTFLRHRIPYLRSIPTARLIFLSFLIGCIGTAFLIRVDVPSIPYAEKLFGDAVSLLAVLAETTGTLALIHYAKMKHCFSGFDFISRRVLIIALILLPIVILNRDLIFTLNRKEWTAILWLATFDIVFAYMFGYLAYQKLDGLIAYLLFNISSLITVFVEVTFFGMPFSTLFAIGAILIIAATISAELINTKCEKEGL